MAKSIKDLLPHVLGEATAQHRGRAQLERQWARAVGARLAAQTRIVNLHRGTLTVQTDSPGASFLLSLDKPALLKKMQRATTPPVTELVIRAGDRPEQRWRT